MPGAGLPQPDPAAYARRSPTWQPARPGSARALTPRLDAAVQLPRGFPLAQLAVAGAVAQVAAAGAHPRCGSSRGRRGEAEVDRRVRHLVGQAAVAGPIAAPASTRQGGEAPGPQPGAHPCWQRPPPHAPHTEQTGSRRTARPAPRCGRDGNSLLQRNKCRDAANDRHTSGRRSCCRCPLAPAKLHIARLSSAASQAPWSLVCPARTTPDLQREQEVRCPSVFWRHWWQERPLSES